MLEIRHGCEKGSVICGNCKVYLLYNFYRLCCFCLKYYCCLLLFDSKITCTAV